MKQFVRDLKVGVAVDSEFLVTEKSLVSFNQPNRSGEQFLRMTLADISGTVRAVVWEKGPEVASKFKTGDIVHVRGEVGEYRGLQLVIYSLEAVSNAERRYFQAVAPRDESDMLAELNNVLGAVADPFLGRLLRAFFEDEEFLSRFAKAPAARSVHHNYLGGLLEHSLEVASFCRHILTLYPNLNASLLYSGALLHDIGKIDEYDVNSLTFELTTRGKLLGHISLGKEMIDKELAVIDCFPEELGMELSHLILSHHGHKEWGSPEVPKTFEAFALFHADLTSARLNQFAKVVSRGSDATGWTEWDRLLDRSVFLGLVNADTG
ncbi:MAG: HD domain-containing protein [Dethiobacter sp.]|nr:HD domain-containing protein [Dethiobacter sp.]